MATAARGRHIFNQRSPDRQPNYDAIGRCMHCGKLPKRSLYDSMFGDTLLWPPENPIEDWISRKCHPRHDA